MNFKWRAGLYLQSLDHELPDEVYRFKCGPIFTGKCSYRDLNPGQRNESPLWWATTLYERGSFACIVLYLEMASLRNESSFTFRFSWKGVNDVLRDIFTFTFHLPLIFLLIYGRLWILLHEQQRSNKLCWPYSNAKRYWGTALVPPNNNSIRFC